jgi:hypothetical protein
MTVNELIKRVNQDLQLESKIDMSGMTVNEVALLNKHLLYIDNLLSDLIEVSHGQ